MWPRGFVQWPKSPCRHPGPNVATPQRRRVTDGQPRDRRVHVTGRACGLRLELGLGIERSLLSALRGRRAHPEPTRRGVKYSHGTVENEDLGQSYLFSTFIQLQTSYTGSCLHYLAIMSSEPLYPAYLPTRPDGFAATIDVPPFAGDEPGRRAIGSKVSELGTEAVLDNITPRIGTEIKGVQLSKLSKAGLDEVALLAAQRGVLVFVSESRLS